MKNWWQQIARGAAPVDVRTLRQRQHDWLMACLHRNAGGEYGRQHGFAHITSAEDYRRSVPLNTYETLQPFITRMADGERDVLFTGQPVAFERTGGSTSGGKLIPYSIDSLADFSRAVRPWLADLAVRFQLDGPAYWAISPVARESETTPGGVPVGLPDAAYLGEDLIPAFAALSAVPSDVGTLTDRVEWQKQTWLALLRCENLSLISVWSPTFLLALFDALPGLANALRPQLDQAAARRLQAFIDGGHGQTLWPRLRLVSCWGHGASSPFFVQLRMRLSHARFQVKGLLATEGVATVPDTHNRPVLAADSGFFEFLDMNGTSWLAHELQPRQRYELVMTTAGGLYRYRTGDMVCYEDDSDANIQLGFLGRSGLVSDLVGEKLTDAFVTRCLPDSSTGFCMLIPVMAETPYYVLVSDPSADDRLTAWVEKRLMKNPQYAYARQLGQLQPLKLLTIRHPLAAYQQRMAQRGMRLGDIKPVALRPETDWIDYFLQQGG